MMKKKLLFSFLYCFYLLTVLFIIDCLFYLSYLSKILPKSFPSSVFNSITGYPHVDKKSSFVNFNKAKNSNIIRIGCFGDSFTHGDEVNDIYDYPTLLQDIFRQHGYDNVEVINFGMGGAGFHQTFNIWKFIGKEYYLDYVILGPQSFQYDRDSTFTGSSTCSITNGLSFLHARYVLKDKKVELIDLTGIDYNSKIANYLSFIPHAKYLFYDIRPPAFLNAPVYCLLPNRTLRQNPFYYNKNLKKEMFDIYAILLNKIAIDVPQVILFNYKDKIANIGKNLNIDNVASFCPINLSNFPYKAGFGHNSPNSNRFLAQQLFDCLTGEKESIQSVIKTVTISEKIARKSQIRKAKLSEFKDIGIEINGIKLGRFYDPIFQPWDKYCVAPKCEPLINPFADVTSIIAFRDRSNSVLDWVFLTLNFDIDENMPVTMRVKNIKQSKDFPLGKTESLYPGANIGIIDIDPCFFNHEKTLLTVQKDILVQNANSLEGKREIVILLNDIPILSTKFKGKNGNLEFYPINGRFLFIRADGREIVDLSKLKTTGLIYLFLESKQQEPVLRIPLAKWIKMDNKASFDRRILHPIDDKYLKWKK